MSSEEIYQPAFTVASLNALEVALSKGVREVEYSDKKIEYRSTSDIIKLIAYIKRALNIKKKGKGLFGGGYKQAILDKGLGKNGRF